MSKIISDKPVHEFKLAAIPENIGVLESLGNGASSQFTKRFNEK